MLFECSQNTPGMCPNIWNLHRIQSECSECTSIIKECTTNFHSDCIPALVWLGYISRRVCGVMVGVFQLSHWCAWLVRLWNNFQIRLIFDNIVHVRKLKAFFLMDHLVTFSFFPRFYIVRNNFCILLYCFCFFSITFDRSEIKGSLIYLLIWPVASWCGINGICIVVPLHYFIHWLFAADSSRITISAAAAVIIRDEEMSWRGSSTTASDLNDTSPFTPERIL